MRRRRFQQQHHQPLCMHATVSALGPELTARATVRSPESHHLVVGEKDRGRRRQGPPTGQPRRSVYCFYVLPCSTRREDPAPVPANLTTGASKAMTLKSQAPSSRHREIIGVLYHLQLPRCSLCSQHVSSKREPGARVRWQARAEGARPRKGERVPCAFPPFPGSERCARGKIDFGGDRSPARPPSKDNGGSASQQQSCFVDDAALLHERMLKFKCCSADDWRIPRI